MTWGQLKQIVKGLVNERDDNAFNEEYGARIVESANSGIMDLVTTVFPKRATAKINHRVLPNLSPVSRLKKEKEAVCVSAESGVGISFYCDGNGRAEIFSDERGKEGEIVMSSSSEPVFYSYLVKGKGNVKIVFTGDLSYTVYDLGVFPYLFEAGKVPSAGKRKEYFLEEIVGDFMSFDNVNPVLWENEISATEEYCILSDKSIILYKEGLYSVPYFAYPVLVTENTEDNDLLDMPEKACRLLALYVASELYADYDLQQSRVFRQDYFQGKSESFSESDIKGQWKNTTGWK